MTVEVPGVVEIYAVLIFWASAVMGAKSVPVIVRSNEKIA
jgi:hypothetical protein